MEIQGISQIHGPHGVQGPHSNRAAEPPQQNNVLPTSGDQLDISPAAEAAPLAAAVKVTPLMVNTSVAVGIVAIVKVLLKGKLFDWKTFKPAEVAPTNPLIPETRALSAR